MRHLGLAYVLTTLAGPAPAWYWWRLPPLRRRNRTPASPWAGLWGSEPSSSPTVWRDNLDENGAAIRMREAAAVGRHGRAESW